MTSHDVPTDEVARRMDCLSGAPGILRSEAIPLPDGSWELRLWDIHDRLINVVTLYGDGFESMRSALTL